MSIKITFAVKLHLSVLSVYTVLKITFIRGQNSVLTYSCEDTGQHVKINFKS